MHCAFKNCWLSILNHKPQPHTVTSRSTFWASFFLWSLIGLLLGTPPLRAQESKLLVSGGEEDDHFGSAVAIDDVFIAVGAHGTEDPVAMQSDRGAVYVYSLSENTWSQEARLAPIGPLACDHFGYSVALEGDVLVVGAPGPTQGCTAWENPGSASVFRRQGAVWLEETILRSSDGEDRDRFGWSVDLDGNSIIVGAPSHNGRGGEPLGAVYVFVYQDGNWIEQSELVASDGSDTDSFGHSVSLKGDLAIVGAPFGFDGMNNRNGAAYIYSRDNETWTEQFKLNAPEPLLDPLGGEFGWSVALGDSRAYAGDIYDDSKEWRAGAVHVYLQEGSEWTHEAELTASNASQQAVFGYSISVSGDRVLIGAPSHFEGPNLDIGAAYLFGREGVDWTEQTKLIGGVGELTVGFGFVALSGDYAVVGAPNTTSRTGSAYAYGPISLPIDDEGAIEISDGYDILSTYPNPFSTQTVLSLSVSSTQAVTAVLFDILGRKLDIIYDDFISSGETQRIVVDGTYLSEGIYFVHIRGQTFGETRAVMLIK